MSSRGHYVMGLPPPFVSSLEMCVIHATTVRLLLATSMAARKRIDNAEQTGPRIYSSGPYFGTAQRGWNQSATAADIDRDVDYWAAQGARAFKAKGIAPEHLAELVARAHQHGLTVTATSSLASATAPTRGTPSSLASIVSSTSSAATSSIPTSRPIHPGRAWTRRRRYSRTSWDSSSHIT